MPLHAHGGDARDAQKKEGTATAVLETSFLYFASEKAAAEAELGRCSGVLSVEMNPVAQTTIVTYDPTLISLVELRDCIQRCGYECRGQSAPEHLCDPMAEPDPSDLATATVSAPAASEEHESARHAHAEETLRSPEERMGHGGHAGMSMDAMVTNARRRFLVAAFFSIPILLWSPIGRDVLGFSVAPPFGLRDDAWSMILSLPVILYASSIFFDRAVAGLLLVAAPGGAGRGAKLALVAAVAITGGTLLARRLGELDLVVAAAWNFLLGGALLAAWAAIAEGAPRIDWTPRFVAVLAFLALVGTAAAFVAWFAESLRSRLAELAAWTFLVPVVGIALAAFLLAEAPTGWSAGGIFVVVLSIWVVQRPSQRPVPTS
jgi:EamA-like transporter family